MSLAGTGSSIWQLSIQRGRIGSVLVNGQNDCDWELNGTNVARKLLSFAFYVIKMTQIPCPPGRGVAFHYTFATPRSRRTRTIYSWRQAIVVQKQKMVLIEEFDPVIRLTVDALVGTCCFFIIVIPAYGLHRFVHYLEVNKCEQLFVETCRAAEYLLLFQGVAGLAIVLSRVLWSVFCHTWRRSS